jgi:hypothetical protein
MSSGFGDVKMSGAGAQPVVNVGYAGFSDLMKDMPASMKTYGKVSDGYNVTPEKIGGLNKEDISGEEIGRFYSPLGLILRFFSVAMAGKEGWDNAGKEGTAMIKAIDLVCGPNYGANINAAETMKAQEKEHAKDKAKDLEAFGKLYSANLDKIYGYSLDKDDLDLAFGPYKGLVKSCIGGLSDEWQQVVRWDDLTGKMYINTDFDGKLNGIDGDYRDHLANIPGDPIKIATSGAEDIDDKIGVIDPLVYGSI